jgi:hypothetical protein
MQHAGVRIVDDAGTVAGDHHQPCEVMGQRHAPQHFFGHVDAGGRIRRGIETGCRIVRALDLGESKPVAQKLVHIDGTHGFDEGEGGNGR